MQIMLKETPSDMDPDGNLSAWLISEVQQAKVGRHLDFTMQTAWNSKPDGKKMWVDRVEGEDEVQKTTEGTKTSQHFFLWKQRLRSEKGILYHFVIFDVSYMKEEFIQKDTKGMPCPHGLCVPSFGKEQWL